MTKTKPIPKSSVGFLPTGTGTDRTTTFRGKVRKPVPFSDRFLRSARRPTLHWIANKKKCGVVQVKDSGLKIVNLSSLAASPDSSGIGNESLFTSGTNNENLAGLDLGSIRGKYYCTTGNSLYDRPYLYRKIGKSPAILPYVSPLKNKRGMPKMSGGRDTGLKNFTRACMYLEKFVSPDPEKLTPFKEMRKRCLRFWLNGLGPNAEFFKSVFNYMARDTERYLKNARKAYKLTGKFTEPEIELPPASQDNMLKEPEQGFTYFLDNMRHIGYQMDDVKKWSYELYHNYFIKNYPADQLKEIINMRKVYIKVAKMEAARLEMESAAYKKYLNGEKYVADHITPYAGINPFNVDKRTGKLTRPKLPRSDFMFFCGSNSWVRNGNQSIESEMISCYMQWRQLGRGRAKVRVIYKMFEMADMTRYKLDMEAFLRAGGNEENSVEDLSCYESNL